jgi:ParB-like chromosome segregation protein Spo0J
VVVDGFHRTTVMRTQADVRALTGGYLPVVVLDKPMADRMASTVRHNRARGKHSVGGMSNLVFQMLTEGKTDAEVCNSLGLEPEELARLKFITGYAKLYEDTGFTQAAMTDRQLRQKAEYAEAHPDEQMPVGL